MDDISNDTPDRELRAGEVYIDGRKSGCFRDEPDLVEGLFEAADQHLSIEAGYYDLAADRFQRSVDDDDIAVEDADAGHRFSADAHKESGRLIMDQLFVEIDASFH